jgi:hypothetical protein
MSFFWGRTVVPSKATIHERCNKSAPLTLVETP